MELKIVMLLGFALELIAIGAIVMCAVYLREIAAVLKRRGG
jgi:hypothetical protein